MITLLDVLDLLEKHNITDGYIVGGIAEHGFSDNDVDIITDAELPAPFHVITNSKTPQGPAIDVRKLRRGKAYLSSLTNSADRAMFADSMNLHIDSSKLVDTKYGLVIKDAIICRAMVLDYGGKKVLKSPEVLAASMPTMQRMMITNNHPSARVITDINEIKGRVLPETIKLIKDAAIGDLLITDKALADEVRNGKRDLSPGYFANVIDQTGTFNDEPYSAVQTDVIYDHLAVVKLGRCSRPICGIVDSGSDESLLQKGDLEKVNDLNDEEKQVQDAATLASDGTGARDVALADAAGANKPTGYTISTDSTNSTDSSSSITDEIKVQETKETMAESIVVDGVGYTPEMVKKLVADSAALTEAQKLANEAKKLLDAREVAFVDQGKALAASEARIVTMQATIDAAEQEKRAPLIKQIMDATPTLKIEDFKGWDLKRLTDTAASTLEAARLRAKTDGKGTKSVVDDAYAKIGAKGGK
jgi:hypothetical protein